MIYFSSPNKNLANMCCIFEACDFKRLYVVEIAFKRSLKVTGIMAMSPFDRLFDFL